MNGQWGDESAEDTVTIVGTVKWFNAMKGFGFVCPNDGTDDVFIHLSCLRDAGYEDIQEGALITCEAVRRSKGLQAVRVTHLDNSSSKLSSRIEVTPHQPRRPRSSFGSHQGHHQHHDDENGNGRFLPGTSADGFINAQVKWFSSLKGYGFLSCGDGSRDVFIHMEALRKVGLSDLQPGQTIRIRIGPGPKGPQVADIQANV